VLLIIKHNQQLKVLNFLILDNSQHRNSDQQAQGLNICLLRQIDFLQLLLVIVRKDLFENLKVILILNQCHQVPGTEQEHFLQFLCCDVLLIRKDQNHRFILLQQIRKAIRRLYFKALQLKIVLKL